MIINYQDTMIVTEEKSFEIEDRKNCFLRAVNKNDNRTVYFGSWVNNSRLKVVTIHDRQINFDYASPSCCNEIDIKKFLQDKTKIEKIDMQTFFNRLEEIKRILE